MAYTRFVIDQSSPDTNRRARLILLRYLQIMVRRLRAVTWLTPENDFGLVQHELSSCPIRQISFGKRIGCDNVNRKDVDYILVVKPPR